ncbi:MAG: hypothetical protein JXA81_13135, partial [Sedimentisphaerales bacterium]|nr:hypothetical protein [Sedimentisphaerales bacterium]
MAYRRLAGFIPEIKRIGVFTATFAVLLIFNDSICYCAQQRQNPATSAGQAQDANSISATVPVPPEAPIVDATAQITEDGLKAKKKEISESQELSDEVKSKINET